MPTIRGRVVAKWAKTPVSSAIINIDGKTAITDNNGLFSFNTDSIVASIKVMHTKYETLEETVSLESDVNEVEIELTPVARAL